MDFYVIYQNPEFNVRVNDVETIDKVTYEKEDPFMIVAAYKVNDGEIYQAVKAGPHRVLLNRKSFTDMHQYVENVDTLAEAFEAIAEEEEQPPVKYTVTFTTAHGDAPASVQVTAGQAIGTLPSIEEQMDDTAIYTFAGWKLGDQNITASFVPTGNATLTAVWNEEELTPNPQPQEP